ncbi:MULTISPECIES: M20 aminoacylase family protein [Comamonas]|uniref:M20 aminoacylase family protein n=1 Tax=Comamonas TaxID=283 RepID=UPI0001DA6F58|nr:MULTISPECIES: M20 aminoacylase family protein [Comamonas]EFI60538.1 amidohydrolase [Comamonas thiooxydans]TFF59102.1 amidohydrolase [Comamonas sp. A23]
MHSKFSSYIDTDAMLAWRHAIHRHPELGFEEFQTSALVGRCLREWGYEVTTDLAGTGLVGSLKFGPGSRRLGLRAEMDALPIQENTGLSWASEVPGKMHGCGHDGHTTMLLGAAQALAKLHREGKHAMDGMLHLIFQPAEELGGAGGAQRMMKEGLFSRFPCDAVFAMHNMPGMEQGQILFREGACMASSDRATLVFEGCGGHGAMPHLATDPTVVAASTVMALQSIVARNVDPLASAVITVGRLQAGQTYNVIPETAELELSIRALKPEVRDLLEARIRAVAQGQADSFGAQCHITYERGYPVLVNSPAETQLAMGIARSLFGDARVVANADPLCASEDFAYMLEERPGCYLFIGNGDNGHTHGSASGPCNVHNPSFDFNDRNLETGATFWTALAHSFLSTHARS